MTTVEQQASHVQMFKVLAGARSGILHIISLKSYVRFLTLQWLSSINQFSRPFRWS